MWSDESPIFGLPKIKVVKIKVAKKEKKEEKKEEAATETKESTS